MCQLGARRRVGLRNGQRVFLTIKCFYGATGNFPVGFLVWNLAKRRHLKDQSITLDVFNADVEYFK